MIIWLCFLLLGQVRIGISFSNINSTCNELSNFKQRSQKYTILTTSSGGPIGFSETSTINDDLISKQFFLDFMGHFMREKITERTFNAIGSGAFGYFEVTNDISDVCKAEVFSVKGKKTPVAVRFSQYFGSPGASDLALDGRGFAVKFYTEYGNLDIIGTNTPVFALKDPLYFTSLVHSQRSPVTNIPDYNMIWDFLTLRPETLNMFVRIYSDLGTPKSYINIAGYSVHSYQVENDAGDAHFLRFHFLPDNGLKSFTAKEASKIAAVDPFYLGRNLYNAIGSGIYPSWTLYVQILTLEDVKNAEFDVFDVTRLLPEDDYPLRKVGKLVLNKNPSEYFAEVENLAFRVSNLIPGLLGAPDWVFQARVFAYKGAQTRRLGVNSLNIPVNAAKSPVNTYNQDGVWPLKHRYGAPNYYPNSFNGPQPIKEENISKLIKIQQYGNTSNFDQINDFYANEINEDERSRLIENIVGTLSKTVSFIQERAVNIFNSINEDFGARVHAGLRASTTKCDN